METKYRTRPSAKKRPDLRKQAEANDTMQETDIVISEGGAEIRVAVMSGRLVFCAAQIRPAIGQVWAKLFAGDCAFGSALDVNTSLGRDWTNAIDPLMDHCRRRANLARQPGLATQNRRGFLNDFIDHAATVAQLLFKSKPRFRYCYIA